MSDVFEGYERHFCQLSANLSKNSTLALPLNAEQKKQKLSEIKAGIDEAEDLVLSSPVCGKLSSALSDSDMTELMMLKIQKMDLVARSLQPNVKAALLAKLRAYKSDLNNLKSEVNKIVPGNLNPSARDELLESGMKDTLMASADQRARLMMSTERLNRSSDRIKDSRSTMLETEELGVSILQICAHKGNLCCMHIIRLMELMIT